jgi:hypothetical protein
LDICTDLSRLKAFTFTCLAVLTVQKTATFPTALESINPSIIDTEDAGLKQYWMTSMKIYIKPDVKNTGTTNIDNFTIKYRNKARRLKSTKFHNIFILFFVSKFLTFQHTWFVVGLVRIAQPLKSTACNSPYLYFYSSTQNFFYLAYKEYF